MTKWLKIENNIVTQISIERPVGTKIDDYVEGPDDVFVDFIYEEGTFIAPPAPAITSSAVSEERDRRISKGFVFGGKLFDFDMKSKTNISGAAQMAFMAIVSNPAAAKSDKWNGSSTPFVWRTADNSFMTMTGEMVIAFGQKAAAHESSFMKAGWVLKDMNPIPADYKDDKYWPSEG